VGVPLHEADDLIKTLRIQDISMEFPGVRALDRVSFTVENGKVVSLLGENGAGKSTLLKILYGDYRPTSGKVLLDEREASFRSPYEALQNGVSVIYQERQLVQTLSVADNVFLGHPPQQLGFIQTRDLNRATQAIIDEFGLPFKAEDKVWTISVAHQQMVEIMKAYNRKIDIIAFDEPTASLTDTEIRKLFEIIRKLKADDKIVLYVSHRLKEIFEICDEVVVLKDGQLVDKLPLDETTEDALVRMMVGRDLAGIFQHLERNTAFGKVILDVRDLGNDLISGVSFSLREGEILGFSGLVGSGRTELMQSIFGAGHHSSGEILFDGKPVHIGAPSDAIRLGIGLCPEDRKLQGIIPIRPLRENIVVTLQKQLARLGFFLNRKKEREIALEQVKNLDIRASGVEQPIMYLSGGNQQKSIVARWLARKPRVLILDEPTKGIDVGAKAEIYKLICSLARQGIGIIMVSSELPEIIGLCDRVLVMKEGKICGELSRADATEEKVLSYALLQ
jgi:L-arabinose transport system ATP-binding protein